MFKTNEPIKVIYLQKLSFIVEWRTCDRSCQQFFQWKQEKLRSFDKARNILIEKKFEIWAVQNIFPLDFIKYLSYRISANKRPLRLLNFETVSCSTY